MQIVQIADLLIHNLIVTGEIRGDLVGFGASKSEYCDACTQSVFSPLFPSFPKMCKTVNVLLGVRSSIT